MRVNRIVTLLACLCPLASAQTDAGLWRFVHPNAKALIGIDVQRIRHSRVAEEMSAQLHAMPMPMGLTLQFPGMDLLNSIDRVILSSPGRNAANPDEEPPLLIAVSGRFEPVKLTQMFLKAGARRQVFNSVTVYRLQDQKNSDFGFVVLNSQTLLIGDVKSLYSVIERAEKGIVTPPAIVERARDMDVAYDFWAILLTTPSAMASERLPIAGLTAKLNGFEAGIAVRDGFSMDVNLNAITEKAAKEISEQFSKLIHLAAKDRENHPEWSGIDRKMKVRVDRADVHFALRLDAPDVARMAKAFDESRARRQALNASVNVKPQQHTPTLPPPPEQKLVIRIEGLDDGPREIPYRPSNR
jgi:hypothetical protein